MYFAGTLHPLRVHRRSSQGPGVAIHRAAEGVHKEKRLPAAPVRALRRARSQETNGPGNAATGPTEGEEASKHKIIQIYIF